MASLSEGLIADATITAQLWLREARAPNIEAEKVSLRLLGDTLSTAPADAFQVCADVVLELCQADSCGISLRERSDAGGGHFSLDRFGGPAEAASPRHHAETFSSLRPLR
jgi:hypothetical protein